MVSADNFDIVAKKFYELKNSRCSICGTKKQSYFDEWITVNVGTENERMECEECHDERLDDGSEVHCEACNALIDSKYLIQGAEEWICPICNSSICPFM